MDKGLKTVLIIAGIIVGVFFVLPWLGTGGGGQGGMMGPGMMGGMGGWGWFMPFGGILFLVLIVWGIVSLFRWGGSDDGYRSDGRESPLDILKKRYARGDISREEFEEKRRELS